MPDKDEPLGDGVERALQLFASLGQPVAIPELERIVGIQPRFNVAEQAIADHQVPLHPGHEVQHVRAVPLAAPLVDVPTEAVVVVAPHARRAGVLAATRPARRCGRR